MVHRCLPHYGNVSGSKTIFGFFFPEFWIFERNFWYLILMKFHMEVVHNVKYLQYKFCPNRSTFRGVTTFFFFKKIAKKLFFQNLGTLEFLQPHNFLHTA